MNPRAQATQCDAVRELLSDGRWHTTWEFVERGILRVSARIYELRRAGWTIEMRRRERSPWAGSPARAVYEYRLAPAPDDLDAELERMRELVREVGA